MAKVVLCLEEEAVREPALVGLPDENLQSQRWLSVCSSAEQARMTVLRNPEVHEVWVEGSDAIEPINLAAAIKHDRTDVRVCLVAGTCSGSLLSRANAASLDAVYDLQMFVRRYMAVKTALAYAPTAHGPADAPFSEGDARGLRNRPSKESAALAAERELANMQPAKTQPIQRTAFLLTVVSGSGGAGKSTVSALAALCAQMHGLKTVLVDFDLQFGNVASFFKNAPQFSIDELLADPGLISRITGDQSLPVIIAPPRRLEDSEKISKHVVSILELLSSSFEVVVANTGASWSEGHAELLERSSQVLFLVDQRSSSLDSCRHALELCQRCGIATGQFLYAVNRCTKDALYTSIDISCAMKGAASCELREGGRDVEDFASAGVIADLALARNPLYVSLEGVLSSFVPGIEVKATAHAANGRALKWPRKRSKKGDAHDDAA